MRALALPCSNCYMAVLEHTMASNKVPSKLACVCCGFAFSLSDIGDNWVANDTCCTYINIVVF